MEAIQWKRNKFITLYAKIKIRLGNQATSYTLAIGDEFEFDGTMCKYSGAEFPQPSLRGAINQGWASTDPNDNSRVVHNPAQRTVAKATSVNRDLSRVQNQENMETGDFDEDTVLEIGDRKQAMTDGRGHLRASDNRRVASRAGMRIEESDADSQDAVVVSRITTPARRIVDVSANPMAAQKIAEAGYEQGVGKSRVVEGISMRTNVGSMRGAPIIQDDNDEGVVVGRVRNSQKSRTVEGITITDTSDIRTPKVRRVASQPVVEESVQSDSSNKLSVAQSIYNKFPADWNFFAKTEDKISKIEKLGAPKQLIQALLASESKAMRKLLREKYPKFA
jgi:hypothetical protein